jgi:phospholipid N-methyltransferase
MSSNYYEMRSAKVRIAHELMDRGWDVKGYKKDESDSMTDYWSPANWGGIAIKNGFVLCVDTPYEAKKEPIKKYNYNGGLSVTDKERIEKLKEMTQERGATEGEEANAKALIEKIKNNKSDIPEYEITGYTIAHMANPGRCKWHIEKDGSIYDKGTGITKYSEVPDEWIFDINTMEFKDGYKTWQRRSLTENQLKAVNDLKALILRWERIVNSMNGMGDGTKETEEQAKEQQTNEKMEKVIKKVTKKVLKMVEIKRDYFKIGDYLTLPYHGHYWKITGEHMQKGTWKGIKEERKAFTYEIVGSASRGYKPLKNPKSYYNYEYQMIPKIEKGEIKIFELKEVEEVTEIEKWIRVKTPKAKKQTAKTKAKENTTTPEDKNTHNTNEAITAAITLNNDKNGIEIRFTEKPSTEIRSEMKSHGFRWGGIKNNCWYTKQSDDKINFANELVNRINNIDIIADEAINNITIEEDLENNNKTKSIKQTQINYTKLLDKVNKQIESNNKTIDQYSGDYKVNTWKRMREQEGRDQKIRICKHDNSILEYIKNKIDNHTITELDQQLIVKAFRNDINSYYRNSQDFKNPVVSKIEFPKYRPEWGEDNWYNIDITKKIKRLNKANIHNTNDLLKVVEEYKIIIDKINNTNPIDLQAEKIKKLERQYKMDQKGDINFTSKNIVEQLINYADIKENDKVLEPSAGIGNIADVLKQYSDNIDVCEYMNSYRELLKLKGHNVINSNFLECNNHNTYDKVVMNPPFSKNQDIQHVKHAYECLNIGGKLVSITSNHWTFANDKESISFRNWLDTVDYEIYDLPSGSFEFTNIACKILIINKDKLTITKSVV